MFVVSNQRHVDPRNWYCNNLKRKKQSPLKLKMSITSDLKSRRSKRMNQSTGWDSLNDWTPRCEILRIR